MEIEVGEYVRTNSGIIRKVIDIQPQAVIVDKDYLILDKKEEYGILETIVIEKDEVTKHSKNILDLIEEWDYVNNGIVDEICKDDKTGETKSILVTNKSYNEICFEEQIHNVVTKQQFSNIEYKVGE